MGKCLGHSAIFADERDEKLQKRFFPTGIKDHVKPERDLTYWYDKVSSLTLYFQFETNFYFDLLKESLL
jgi:hypothetical protein